MAFDPSPLSFRTDMLRRKTKRPDNHFFTHDHTEYCIRNKNGSFVCEPSKQYYERKAKNKMVVQNREKLRQQLKYIEKDLERRLYKLLDALSLDGKNKLDWAQRSLIGIRSLTKLNLKEVYDVTDNDESDSDSYTSSDSETDSESDSESD